MLQANIPLIVNYTKTSLAESMQVLQVNKENSKLMSYIIQSFKKKLSHIISAKIQVTITYIYVVSCF